MLEVSYLLINGITSYSKQQEIQFHPGTTVILGDNGSGKTSLIQAIYVCLFGVPLEGTLQDLLVNGRNVMLILACKINGQELEIERNFTWKKDNTSLSGRTAILYFKNQKRKPLTGPKAVSNEITDILGISQNAIRDAIFVKQGTMLKYVSMSKTEFKNEFVQLLKLDQYQTLASIFRSIGRDLGIEITAKTDDVPKLEESIKTKTEKEKEKKKSLKILKEHQMKFTSIEAKKGQFDDLGGLLEKFDELNTDLASFQDQLSEFDLKPSDCDSKKLASLTHDEEKSQEELTSYESIQSELLSDFDNLAESESTLTTYQDTLKKNKILFTQNIRSLEDKEFEFEDEEKQLEYWNLDNQKDLEELDEEQASEKTRLESIEEQHTEISIIKEELQTNEKELTPSLNLLDQSNGLGFNLSSFEGNPEAGTAYFNKLIDEQSELEGLLQNIQDNIDKTNRLKLQNEVGHTIQIDLIDDLKSNISTSCPVCFSKLDSITSEENIAHMDEAIKRVAEELKKMDDKITELKSQKPDTDRIENLKSFVRIFKKSPIESVLESLVKWKAKIESNNDKIVLLYKQYPELELTQKKLRDRFNLIDATRSDIEELLLCIKRRETYQKLEKEELVNVKAFQKSIQTKLKKKKLPETLQDKDSFTTAISNLMSELLILSNTKSAVSGYLSSLEKIELVQKNVNEVMTDKKFLKTYQEASDEKARSKLVKDEIVTLEKELGIVQDLITAEEQTKDNLSIDLGAIKADEKRLADINSTIENTKRNQNHALLLVKIIEGIYPRILNYKIRKINHLVNSYLLNFTNGGNAFQIKMENTKRDLILKVVRSSAATRFHERPISTLSGGEKMSLAFALRIAISKELAETGFMVLDEPTDGLDDDRKQQVARLVEEQNFVNQLLVISHDSAFDNDNNAAIKVSRDSEGATRIQTEGGFGMDLRLPTD
ncbi:MAG: SMC family ATPase [Candidatus Heimdallarchaeota archaeon]|nr:SMC family ATPase [Candidatus Heimdallarchaeota archaeon]